MFPTVGRLKCHFAALAFGEVRSSRDGRVGLKDQLDKTVQRRRCLKIARETAQGDSRRMPMVVIPIP